MRWLGLCCFIWSASTQAQGPVSPRPVQVVVTGGMQLPVGDFGDTHDMGIHADVSVIFSALRNLRVRPELSYARFKFSELIALPNGSLGALGGGRDAYSDLASTLLSGVANIEIPLGPANFQPFLLAGLGAVSFKSDATDQTASAFSEVRASINVGAGVRFKLGGIGGIVEARLNNIPGGDKQSFRNAFRDVRSIPVSFGLVF